MLGRWNMKNVTRTVEQAMHDNCGCTKTVDVIQEPFDNTMEISLCALQSFHVYGLIMVYIKQIKLTKMYTPENKYEYETILHLGSMSFIDHDNMKGATEYARRYLIKRYGSDPDIELIPLYFSELQYCHKKRCVRS